jgi:uncharacterized protein (TIGR02145 family)
MLQDQSEKKSWCKKLSDMKMRNQGGYYLSIVLGLIIIMIGCSKKTDDNNNPASTPGTVTDIDGNSYHTIKIGTQVWLVENLKTTKYNDGTNITQLTDNAAWNNLTSPGYWWYDNDPAYKNTYGALYNWYAVNTGKLAPKGWHIPTDAEWTILTTFLGGESVAGGKMKEVGFTHWISPNTGATNSSGFTALPGGYRWYDGNFFSLKKNAEFWSSSQVDTTYAWGRELYYDSEFAFRFSDGRKLDGYSCRCLHD